jgi:hypothetical protein
VKRPKRKPLTPEPKLRQWKNPPDTLASRQAAGEFVEWLIQTVEDERKRKHNGDTTSTTSRAA